jgi:hypothetical protein
VTLGLWPDSAAARDSATVTGDSAVAPPGLPVIPSGSFYRGARGFRESATPVGATGDLQAPITVKQLLDSAALALPTRIVAFRSLGRTRARFHRSAEHRLRATTSAADLRRRRDSDVGSAGNWRLLMAARSTVASTRRRPCSL